MEAMEELNQSRGIKVYAIFIRIRIMNFIVHNAINQIGTHLFNQQ
jgi:hypothetical protein